MWDSTSKALFFRTYNPGGINTVTASSITTPVNGAQLALDSTIINFEQGSNIQITGSGNTVTIASTVTDSAQTVAFAMSELNIVSGAGEFGTQIRFSFTNYLGGVATSTISGTNGVDISSVSNNSGGRDFTIDAGKKTWNVDYPNAGGTSSDGSTGGTSNDLASSMDLTDEESADLLIIVDVSAIVADTGLTSALDNTITLPPPYPGRKIKVVLQPVPSSGSTPQQMSVPLRFQIANASTKDTTVRTSKFCGRSQLIQTNGTAESANAGQWAVQSLGAGSGSAKSYISFQDCTHPNSNNDSFSDSSTQLGIGIGTQFELVAVSADRYVADIRAFAAFGLKLGITGASDEAYEAKNNIMNNG